MTKIVHVSNDDDWEGLYIDGKLAIEDHRLSVRDVLDVLAGCQVDEVETVYCDGDWLYEQSHLPVDYDDVVVQT